MQRLSCHWYVSTAFIRVLVAQANSRAQRDEKRDDVTDGQLVPRGAPSQGEQQTGEDITATETNATISEESKEEGGRESVETPDDGTAQPELSDVAVPLSDHQSRILDPETDMPTTNRDESEKAATRTRSCFSI